jgi:hypothetical protein
MSTARAPGLPERRCRYDRHRTRTADVQDQRRRETDQAIPQRHLRADQGRRLRTVKQGSATLITAAALADCVRLLEQEARAGQ